MTSTVSTTVKSDVKDNIGIITLSNQSKRNALSKALLQDLNSALADFVSKKIPVVILRS